MDTDDRPSRCPYGHPLAGGLAHLGWQPCQCRVAMARARGHVTYTCRICSIQGWTMVYFEPEHIPAADEAGGVLVGVRQADVLEGVRQAAAKLEQARATPEELTRYRHILASREKPAT